MNETPRPAAAATIPALSEQRRTSAGPYVANDAQGNPIEILVGDAAELADAEDAELYGGGW